MQKSISEGREVTKMDTDDDLTVRQRPRKEPLVPNVHVIRKALNGPRDRHRFKGHPGLYLDAWGNGTGAWTVRSVVDGKQRTPRPRARCASA